MKCWNQRCALTTRSHVGRPEIGHHINAGLFCEPGRRKQLKGIAQFRSVPDGLSMRPECLNILRLQSGRRDQLGDHLGIQIRQLNGRERSAG